MPDQRLQKCRDAYREPSWMELSSAQRIALMLGAIQSADDADALRRTSAAYRITQAQLAADQRTAGDERL